MRAEPAEFNDIIHAPLRLRICGLLRGSAGVDFAVLRDTLDVSDASLSKHLKVLIDAGLVAMAKNSSVGRSDKRRIAWVTLTPAGTVAFDSHVRALRTIAGEL